MKKWEKERLVQHLPNGGKPPATEDDEGLRAFLDSKWGMDSDSGCLLPVPLTWDEFCENIIFIHTSLQRHTQKVKNNPLLSKITWHLSKVNTLP